MAASVQSLLFIEIHTPYIVCVCVHTAVTWRGHRGHTTAHTGVTQLSHTGVTGKTTAACRDHRGSYNCHTQESQADAQLLHGEVTGVTQKEENNRIITLLPHLGSFVLEVFRERLQRVHDAS